MRLCSRLGSFLALLLTVCALGAQTLPPEVTQGRDWLASQVRTDGSVTGESTTIATQTQTRAEVLETLKRLERTPTALASLLSQQTPDSAVEHLARQIISQAGISTVPAARIDQLKAYQNADGGFGGSAKFGSNVLDTSFALIALRAAGVSSGNDLARAVTYLATRAAELDNKALSLEAGSRPYVASYVLMALQSYAAQFPIAQAVEAARTYLLAQQGQGAYLEALLNAVGAIALGFSSTSGTGLDDLRTALRASQMANGSWEDDPYLTALALRGLIGAVVTTPPQTGRITATIREASVLAPVSGANITLTGAGTVTGSSAGNGAVILADLQPGVYTGAVEKTGFSPATLSGLNVVAGQTLDLGFIDLVRSASTAVLRGRVTDVRDGSPLAGAAIAVNGAVSQQIISSPDGRFEFVSQSAGAITVSVSKAGFQTAQASGNLVLGRVLEFSPALYPDGFTPPGSAVLIGVVVSSEGDAPIAGATVQVGAVQAQTNADGAFQLVDLPAGALSAQITAAGFLSAQINGTLASGVNNIGMIRLAPDQAATTSTVTGRITDADNGTPIVGALIEVSAGGLRASSGPDGRYQIEGIAQIPFTLTTTAAGYQSRSVTAGSQVHGSFVADVALDKLTGGDFALESVVMSAAEYQPYSEASVVGTIRNLGLEEAGLIFNAIVLDSNQQFIRDVPAVRLVFNSSSGENILPVAAGATRSVTIIWGTLDDAPGTYSVLFRGVNPNGQVAVEGSTGYRIVPLKRIGGAVSADPPLLQAGLGQTVGLSARLTNLGNLPIPAGEANLSVTLVRTDTRPPAPLPPVMGNTIVSGAPLDRPLRGVADASGNVYTVNRYTRELLRIAPDGSTNLLRVLGTGSGPNGQGGTNISQVTDIALHPDGALRIASITGWITRVDLTEPYLQSSTQLPILSVSAYVVDSSGNEYISGTYQGRHRVLKRSPGGLLSVAVDAGINNPGGAVAGIDGHLYITNDAQGVVYRVDGQSGAVAPFASGLTRPNGIVANSDGSFFIAESTTGKIRRLAADGTLTDFAEALPTGTNKLQRGNDGQLYWMNGGAGEIRRVDPQGVHHPFARGLVDRPVRVLLDSQNRLVAASSSQIRRRQPDGSQETLAVGLVGVKDFLEESPGQFLIAQTSSIKRVSEGVVTSVITVAGETIVAISKSNSGDVLVWTEGREQRLYRLVGNGLERLFVVPQSIAGVVRSPDGPVIYSSYGIYRLDEEGRTTPVATGFGGLRDVFTGASGELYAYDSGGSGVIGGLFRIDVATASAYRITERLPGLVHGVAVDLTGRVFYGKGRSIDRLDPVTSQVETVATLDSTQYVYYLSVDHLGRIYFGSQGSTLMRLDGASQTQVATQVSSTLMGSDGRLWIRRAAKLYRLGDQDQEELRYTLSGAFSDVALMPQDLPLVYRGALMSLDVLDANAVTIQTSHLPREVTSMRIGAGGIFVRDGSSRLTRYSVDGVPSRLGGDSPGVRNLDTDEGFVYVSRSAGVDKLEVDGSFSSFWSRPEWNSNEYALFAVRGAYLAAANSITQELVLVRDGGLLATLAPIQNATGFAQRSDGYWVSLGAGTIVEISPDGSSSRQINRNPAGLRDVIRRGNELVALSSSVPLGRLDSDGSFVRLASLREMPSGVNYNPILLVRNAQNDFSMTSGGNIYRRNGVFIDPFSSGVGTVSDMDVDAVGRLYIADASSASIGRLDSTGYRYFASGFGSVDTISVIAENAIIAGNSSSLVLANAQGAWSRAPISPFASVPKISRIDGDTAWIIEEGSNRIREISIPSPLPLVPVGTVVHRATRSIAPMGLSGAQSLDFDGWLPQVGGDYEVTVKLANPEVGGQATTGIHVGPNAVAHLSVNPGNVTPGTRQIRVEAHIEGGDFSSLSRVDSSQLQLLLPNAVYPPAMGMDAGGALWYVTSGYLYRALAGQSGLRVGSLTGYAAIRGEVPIDSQQRAYAARRITVSGASFSEVRRVEQNGNSEVFASFPEPVVSMAIDGGDNIYALTADRILQIKQDGAVSDYALLPSGTPYGITRDGAGNIYVQMLGNIIYRIDANRDVSAVLTDARFEYEGVNIAGTCAEGLFFTPNVYDRVGQNGEEYTLAQVLGSTGEIGPILNGQVISDDLLDMDFIVYDRFASRILVMSESSGAKIFSLPVTCGAIDVELHIVLTSDQTLDLVDPPASQMINFADGRKEIVWLLRDVNRQGVDLSYLTSLTNLARGESRQVAHAAWLEFRNTFTEGTIRLPVQVPSVLVEDLIDLDVATDLSSYPQNTNVDIDAFLRNRDDFGKVGRLWVRVEDASGALVETLIDRAEVFGPLEERELDPPFTTGSNRVGSYSVVAEILDNDDRVVARSSSDFEIVAGGPEASLTSTVRTDQVEYRPQQTAILFAEVRNLSSNRGFTALKVRERVFGPDSAEFASFESPLASLEPDALARLQFSLPLGAAAAGRYHVEQKVLDSDDVVLSSVSTDFDVLPELGNHALSGALTVDPSVVVRGGAVNLGAQIQNRGNSALTAVPLKLQVLDPADGNRLVVEWLFSENIGVGESVQLSQVWNTAGVALGDYIVTILGSIGSQSAVLDQKAVRVAGIVLGGTLVAMPADATPADTINLSAQATNSGNLPGTALAFRLEVLRTDSNAVVREWTYNADLAVGGSLTRMESATAASLGVGGFRARWSVVSGAQLQVLAEANFVIRDIQISGTIDATPGSVGINTPVQLSAQVRNLGNLAATDLPVRMEVRRLDTQTVLDAWNETATIAPGGTHLIARQWQSQAAGQFQAVVLAQFGGAWQTLSTAGITVEGAAVDVDMQIGIQRDARLLVLVSCAPGEGASGSSSTSPGNDSDPGRAQAPTACELSRKTFLEQYLSQLAIEHKVVTADEDFMRELRCGRYNTYWLSGGSEKLAVADAKELRETIYRGEGLIIDGSHDQRTSFIDEMSGYNFRGHLPQPNLVLRGTGTLLPVADVATYGRALRLEASTGQVEASFVSTSTPAVISNVFGQGHALSYAFDLVEVLQRDSAQPASSRLFDNGLVFAAPTVVNADFATGAYVPVTTTLENRAQAVDLRLRSSVAAPASVAGAAPTPSVLDTQSAAWDFNLGASQLRSFDLGVRMPSTPTSGIGVLSELSKRNGALLEPLSNVSQALVIRDASATSTQLIAELNGANLAGGERAARDRAVRDIADALQAQAAQQPLAAIAKWVDAAEEMVRITSVPVASWRLANARLLEITQRSSCGITATSLCLSQPAAPVVIGPNAGTFTAFASVERMEVRGGKKGGSDWEWGLGTNTQAAGQFVQADLDWTSGKSYRFTLSYDAQGNGRVQVFDGSSSLFVRDFNANGGVGLRTGDAIDLHVLASNGVGNATLTVATTQLNGKALTQTLATSGNNSEARLSLFYPPLRSGINLEGTVRLNFSGNAPPDGTRLSFLVKAGNLSCTGSAP